MNGKGKLELEREEIEEADLHTMVERGYTTDDLRQLAKLTIEEVEEDLKTASVKNKVLLYQRRMDAVKFLMDYPDEPRDEHAARDFKRFRETTFQTVGQELTAVIMARYDYNYGTSQEKEEAKAAINMFTDKQKEAYIKRRLDKWRNRGW